MLHRNLVGVMMSLKGQSETPQHVGDGGRFRRKRPWRSDSKVALLPEQGEAGRPRAARPLCIGRHLPTIARLEVRIEVLVPMPSLVIVRCVDVHPGRPLLVGGLGVAAGVRSLLRKSRCREDCG
jgi:hypothetical protein